MYKHTHMHAVYVKINKPNINNMGYTWQILYMESTFMINTYNP